MGKIFKNKLIKTKVIAGDDIGVFFKADTGNTNDELLKNNSLKVSKERLHLAKFFFVLIFSIFINPSSETLSNLGTIKPDRVELYTYDYAKHYNQNKNSAIKPYLEVSSYLKNEFPHISLNAGHDLSLIHI